jgi:diguanylate cyclase (GGDEF)-like protein
MIIAVLDNSSKTTDDIKRAVSTLTHITCTEHITFEQCFDRLAVLSAASPLTKPDIILLSFSDTDKAFEIALALKSDTKYVDTPVIIYDTNSNTEEVIGMLESGCYDFIKEISDDLEIFARVRTAMYLCKERVSRLAREKEIEESTQKLENISNTDGLTGVFSGKYFEFKASEEINRAIRTNTLVSALRIDIDGFRKFNQTYGFIEGDRVLKRIASAVKRSINRPGDILARTGGDCFSILLPETDTVGAEHIAKDVAKNINMLAVENDKGLCRFLSATVSGITLKPENHDDFIKLCRFLDNLTTDNNSLNQNVFHLSSCIN